ncbi:hypothetical protein EIP91_008366 [Steccherinum ochraceum]|uniref:NADP-dependent oxidoreductase domain-containing protein n=1 Tax=Steccherinum ochraceum TaxID=92696 RepID=A0A4R0R300_9APHY|nr:hypothetical protein EIP91_008366 [Steccherinum ochraceum]
MVQVFTLNNGTIIPSIGIGCFVGKFGANEEACEMVQTALKLGYRHFDTAALYGTEEGVGKGIRSSDVPREEIYVVTKLQESHHGRVREAFDESLGRLGVGYIDLYLMHWPQGEDLTTGKVKSIGVSNFSVKNLKILLAEATIVPAVNQIEVHPLYPQFAEQEYCKSKGIVITAYSPFALGQKDLIEHATLKEIGSRTGHSPTQVIMGWLLKKGIAAIPKSAIYDRMFKNIEYADISSEDMVKIDAIHKTPGMHRMSWGHLCVDGKVNGWTYEQLGWNLVDGGRVKD